METVIALSILAIGVTLSSTLMATSLRNISTSKERVMAVNMAREGIEAVRNIRDTNWLKFSGSIRDCWNQLPQSLDGGTCAEICNGLNPITPGDYIVYKAEGTGDASPGCDTVQRWRVASLADLGNPLDHSNSVLYQVDISPIDVDTDNDGEFNNDKDIYNHLIHTDPNANINDVMGRNYAQKTNFARIITIEYLENDGTIIDSVGWTGNVALFNRMRVTSKVTWVNRGNEHSVELKTHLTDYLGRDNLDS